MADGDSAGLLEAAKEELTLGMPSAEAGHDPWIGPCPVLIVRGETILRRPLFPRVYSSLGRSLAA